MYSRSVVLALALTGASASLFSNVTEHQRYAFDEFKASYGKHYETAAEDAKRFAFFVENLKIADARNVAEAAAGGTAVHGVTKFSDFSQDEFNSMMLGSKPTGDEKHNLVTPPESGASINVNWAGTYTTPVKNQVRVASPPSSTLHCRYELCLTVISSLVLAGILRELLGVLGDGADRVGLHAHPRRRLHPLAGSDHGLRQHRGGLQRRLDRGRVQVRDQRGRHRAGVDRPVPGQDVGARHHAHVPVDAHRPGRDGR